MIVVGYALIAFHFFVQLLIDLGWLLSGKQPPREWVADAARGEALSSAGEAAL